jgi:hypothetical protein
MYKINFWGLKTGQFFALANEVTLATIKNSWVSILYCSHRLAIYGILLAMFFCPETAQESSGKDSIMQVQNQDSWQSNSSRDEVVRRLHDRTIDLIKQSSKAESTYYNINKAISNKKNKNKEINQLQDQVCQIISELDDELKSFVESSNSAINKETTYLVPAKRRYIYRNGESTIARRKSKEARSAGYTINVLSENLEKMKDLSRKVSLVHRFC